MARSQSVTKTKPTLNGSVKASDPAHHAFRQMLATTPAKVPAIKMELPTKKSVRRTLHSGNPPIDSPIGNATSAAIAQTRVPVSNRFGLICDRRKGCFVSLLAYSSWEGIGRFKAQAPASSLGNGRLRILAKRTTTLNNQHSTLNCHECASSRSAQRLSTLNSRK
jgi:hypothetical protein